MQIWAQKLVPQRLVSHLTGKLAKSRVVWLKNFLIRCFISHYKVDMSEAWQEDYSIYESFNEFFTRLLKPGLRPMPKDPTTVASPVDGAISELGSIEDQKIFQAKGHDYDLLALLGGDKLLVELFRHGHFLTAYLSPKDYHRVHMPVAGVLKKMVYVPGSLFSVNPKTAEGVPNLFARNERVICYFETDRGPMAVIMVAAIVVASIVVQWEGRITPQSRRVIQESNYFDKVIQFDRGDEMGYFELGSTVIVLFGKDKIEWNSLLIAGNLLSVGQELA